MTDHSHKQSIMKLRNSCCCAPYPVVDLTEAFKSQKNLEHMQVLKEQVTNACERYGCFHVVVTTQSPAASDADLSQNANDFNIFQHEEQVRKTFETMFQPQDTKSSSSSSSSSRVSSFRIAAGHDEDGSDLRTARYRGRSAESGSSIGTEPKQSWEIFSCRNMLPSTSLLTTSATVTNHDDDLGILHRYMKVLHQVSVCLLRDVLDLPHLVDSNACQCNNRPNEEQEQEGDCKKHFCSVDLLRAFQYDAVDPSQVFRNLGSSPHTDWGSLTVVWQDSKGGLQIYCHEHQIWNDVGVLEESEDGDGEGLIRFFIHVGDFTSLVMNHSHLYRMDDEKYADRLVWPSPLHRVLCPTLDDHDHDGSHNTMQSSRCSLVYFAYPMKGLSLEDVQNLLTGQSLDQNQSQLQRYDVPYERFLVLNDQSKSKSEKNIMEPEQVYQKIASIPFHQVIQDKWMQVQR